MSIWPWSLADGNELELIQTAMEEDAEGSFANGMMIGMVMG